VTEWFRLWHGAPTDPKWRTVARRASVRPGDVWAVVSCLMDRASQASERGCVSGYDVEIIADALGYEPDDVQRIIDALHDKAVIVSGRLASWEKYQPKREDGSAERGKEYRDRIRSQKEAEELARTQANAGERNRALDTEESREEKKEPLSENSDAGLSLVSETGKRATYPEDFEQFWKAYPTDALMSKKKAAAEWKKLPSDKRAMALVSCPAFKVHCQANPDYRTVHACRYLSEERFVGFAATHERVADVGVHIMAGDPGWDEWQAVKKTPTDAKGGWWFPSKFPDETARMGRRAA